MPALDEVQAEIRAAILCLRDLSRPLAGGTIPHERLAIHRRHYQASLVTGLVRRFPATEWLVGTPALVGAAQQYVLSCVPASPCLAEYGSTFPEFLAKFLQAKPLPWLRSFVELELMIGEVSVCVEYPPGSIEALSRVDSSLLPEISIELQPGLRYLEVSWPIDALMTLYLTEQAPSSYVINPEDLSLQIRGGRGTFRIERLSQPAFVFRRELLAGQSLGAAAERALDVAPNFGVQEALSAVLAEGLMRGFHQPPSGLP